jgi:hypothetical protein
MSYNIQRNDALSEREQTELFTMASNRPYGQSNTPSESYLSD